MQGKATMPRDKNRNASMIQNSIWRTYFKFHKDQFLETNEWTLNVEGLNS